jgi:mannose-1-phosphate guanylyltransferase
MMIMLQETVERINELVLLKQVFIATNEAYVNVK